MQYFKIKSDTKPIWLSKPTWPPPNLPIMQGGGFIHIKTPPSNHCVCWWRGTPSVLTVHYHNCMHLLKQLPPFPRYVFGDCSIAHTRARPCVSCHARVLPRTHAARAPYLPLIVLPSKCNAPCLIWVRLLLTIMCFMHHALHIMSYWESVSYRSSK